MPKEKQNNLLNSIKLAILGSLLSVIVNYFFDPTLFNFWSYQTAFAITIGALAGLFVQLVYDTKTLLEKYDRYFREDYLKILDDYKNEINDTKKSLKIQKLVIDTFLNNMKHDEVIDELMTASLEINFSNIPFINLNQYFEFLVIALKQSEAFEGILDKPIGWYKENSLSSYSYLEKIKHKEMTIKRRVFFIKEEYEEQMISDLNNNEILDFYWKSTGEDTDTYWIKQKDFENYFQGKNLRFPKDSVLFDRSLYIEYSEDIKTLTYKVLDDDTVNELTFFKELDRQLAEEINSKEPFKEIPKPNTKKSVKLSIST